ncbi:MAG TPA: DUF1800 family protein, partial [Gemmatimonadaceae bacterium]|nr:DUF1800 family protein [Gemmatimonadaceae bacterium]
MRTIVAAIAAALALLCGCAPAGRAAPPGEKPPASAGARELTADQQVRHALARLSFGARPGDVERVRAMGVDRWIEHQLHPERIADTAMERFLQHFPAARLSTMEAVRDYAPLPRAPVEQRREAARRSRALVAELQGARVARAVASERQLEEVMVDFWLNHFNVFAGKGPTRFMLAEYEREAIRPHALGRFRDLLGAVAHSPAMLFYLDNWQSTVEDGRPTSASRGIGSRRNDDAPPRPRGDRRSRGGAP